MKKEIFKFLILLMVALGGGPAGAALWQWSTTAGNNGGSDPTINFAEGQAPSSLNDSARALMAAIAINIKDTNGQIISAGTTSALTLTTNTVFPSTSALNGQAITFIAGTSNAAGATLNIDGTGALPIYIDGVTGPIPANTITAGGIYTVTDTSGLYRLHGVYNNPYNTPLGSILWSTLSTPPNANFLVANGQCISTTTYAVYWVAMGSPASGICSGGFFQIIDLRGRVVAGLDTLPGAAAAGRLTSASNGCGTAMTTVGAICANGVEGFAVTLAQLPTGITSSGTSTVTVTLPSGAARFAYSTNGDLLAYSSAGAGAFVSQYSAGNNWALANGMSGGGSASVTSNNTSGTARPSVQPTIGLVPFLRVI